MSGLRVLQPGLLSLLQDRGRYGAHKLGLTTGGPLDFTAFDWANRILDNAANATCLEIGFGGLVLQSEIETGFVITGATTDAAGNAAHNIPIPNTASLNDAVFYTQWLVRGSGCSFTGTALSNAQVVRIQQ